MDVVWDQDVRIILAAIIGREPPAALGENGDYVKKEPERVVENVQLAIRYADELGKARAAQEKRTSTTVQQHRPRYR